MKQNSILSIKPTKLISLFLKLALITTLFMTLFIINPDAQAKDKFEQATLKEVIQVVEKHKGEVVILNVFASWCPPCVQEAPTFVSFYKKYPPKTGVHLYGISLDDNPKELRKFITRRSINFPVYHCTQDFIDYFEIETIPTLLVFNREGNLVENLIGIASMNELTRIINKYK